MKKKWVKKFKTFQEAYQFEQNAFLLMQPSERITEMQFLREQWFQFNKGLKHAKNRKGLRRTFKLIQQTRD